MGVWLEPEPEHFEACYLTCHSDDQLGPLIDAIRHLLFAGVFNGPVNLLHRDRVLIMLGQYPWEAMGGQTPLSESVARQLAAEKRIGMWNGVGAITGSRAQVRACKATIKKTLQGKVDRVTFLSDNRLRLLQRYPRATGMLLGVNVSDLLKTLEGSYGLLKGIPSEVAMSLAYWRNRRPFPQGNINPARDNCGLMWFAPIIPMTEGDVRTFRGIIEPIFLKYGFEACITLTAVNERCFDCTLPLLYDKDNASETERAEGCYRELLASCHEHGYISYRLGLQSMQAETTRDDVFWKTVASLKRAFDPEGILSPGRYAG
jgi:4-cresol dehydrogenase (hydroxylating)